MKTPLYIVLQLHPELHIFLPPGFPLDTSGFEDEQCPSSTRLDLNREDRTKDNEKIYSTPPPVS
jgi:hypothetical protein